MVAPRIRKISLDQLLREPPTEGTEAECAYEQWFLEEDAEESGLRSDEDMDKIPF